MWAAPWQNQQNSMCTQQRLRSAWASTQSDQSLLSAWRKLGFLATQWANRKTDQTGQMPRLISVIWVFAGPTSFFFFFFFFFYEWSIFIWIYLSLGATCMLGTSGKKPQFLVRNHNFWKETTTSGEGLQLKLLVRNHNVQFVCEMREKRYQNLN